MPHREHDEHAERHDDYRDSRVAVLETRLEHLITAWRELSERHNNHVHELRREHRELEFRTRSNERYIAMGLGALAVAQVVLFILK